MLKALKSILFGAMLGVIIPSLAFGQATLLPDANQRYLNDTGQPVANGTVGYYIPNTLTKKTIWQDSGKVTAQTNPVLLDAGGKPQPAGQTYGDGSYRQIVKDSNGVQIWDSVTTSTGSGSSSGGSVFSAGVPVGTILPWASTALPTNYLYTAGQAVSRTTYAQLLTAVTYQQTILCQNGVATVSVTTTVSDGTPIGAPIEASCFAPGTIVSSKASGILTLSTNATSSVSTGITVFPWGNGDGSSTFNVPDIRGRVLAGRDNMNGSIAGVLSSTYYLTPGGVGVNPDALNAVGGSQSWVTTLAQLPTGINSSGSNNLTVTSTVNGIPTNAIPTASLPTSGSATGILGPSSGGSPVVVGAVTSTNTQIINVASTNTSGSPHPSVQPTLTADHIIKALPDTGGSGLTGVTDGVLYNNAGSPGVTAAGLDGQLFLGVTGSPPQMATMSQDCVITNAGAITCTKTNNVAFAPSATTDATNANNITSGVLTPARLPLATNAAKGAMEGDTTTITCVAGVCTAIGAVASSIGVGTTTVSTATSGYCLTVGATLSNAPCGVSTPQGRLTLASGQAEMVADAVGVQNLWYAPDVGGSLNYFNGTSVAVCSFTSSATDQVGLLLALGGSANWAADSIHDVFAYWTGSACALATRAWDASMLPSAPALITPIATAVVTGTTPTAWTRPNAAFDGTTVKVGTSSATIPSGSVNANAANCLGQDYGVGNTNTVTQLVVTAPTDHFIYGNFGFIDFQTSVSSDGTNWFLTNVNWINDTAFGNSYTLPLNTTGVGPWRFIRTCFDGMGDTTRSLFIAQIQYYNVTAASTRRLVRYTGVGLVNDATMGTARISSSSTTSIPQYQGTYLGSIHIDTASTGQITCHVQSFGASRTCGIWNAYPSTQRWITLQAGIYDTAKNYTVTSPGWAACEGSSTFGLQVFTGMAVEPVDVSALRNVVLNSIGGAASYEYGLGVNIGSSTAVTNSFSGTQISTNFDNTGSVHGLTERAEVTLPAFAGLQSVTCIERNNNGSNGSVVTITNGVRAANLKVRYRY